MVRTRRQKRILESVAVRHVLRFLNLKKRNGYYDPFDIETESQAIEVKGLSADCKDLKIHIASNSFERKLKYASENNKTATLIAVLIHGKNDFEIYESEVRQHIRIRNMRKIAGRIV